MKKTWAVGAVATGVLAATAGPALADGAVSARENAGAAASFECEYVGTRQARADRKAPIREGMSRHAPIKAVVKKGQGVEYNYRCVSSKGTHWVKTISPAKGYLYRLHI
jgi:hypothetical protein